MSSFNLHLLQRLVLLLAVLSFLAMLVINFSINSRNTLNVSNKKGEVVTTIMELFDVENALTSPHAEIVAVRSRHHKTTLLLALDVAPNNHTNDPEVVLNNHISSPEVMLNNHTNVKKVVLNNHISSPEVMLNNHTNVKKVVLNNHISSPEVMLNNHTNVKKVVLNNHISSPEVMLNNHTNDKKVVLNNHTNNPEVKLNNDTNNPKVTGKQDIVLNNHINNPEVKLNNDTNNPKVTGKQDIVLNNHTNNSGVRLNTHTSNPLKKLSPNPAEQGNATENEKLEMEKEVIITDHSGTEKNETFTLTHEDVTIANASLNYNVSRAKLSKAAWAIWSGEAQKSKISRKRFFRRPSHQILNILPALTTEPKGICSGGTNESQIPFLLLMVLSSYRDNGVEERRAVRATYGSVARGGRWPSGKPMTATVRLIFLLGTPPTEADRNQTEAEVREYGDLLIGDFIDSYRNLTLKVLVGLRWAADHCEQARYVMKADDDTFINLPLLVTFLQERGVNNVIYGRIYKTGWVFRGGHWGVAKWEYPLRKYPPYLSGTGYVISQDAVKMLLYASEHFPLIRVEDAYVTGVLAVATGIRRMSTNGFTHMTDGRPSVCDYITDSRFVGNRMPASTKYEYWNILEKGDKSCAPY